MECTLRCPLIASYLTPGKLLNPSEPWSFHGVRVEQQSDLVYSEDLAESLVHLKPYRTERLMGGNE